MEHALPQVLLRDAKPLKTPKASRRVRSVPCRDWLLLPFARFSVFVVFAEWLLVTQIAPGQRERACKCEGKCLFVLFVAFLCVLLAISMRVLTLFFVV